MLLRESPSVMSHWIPGTFVTVRTEEEMKSALSWCLLLNTLAEMTWERETFIGLTHNVLYVLFFICQWVCDNSLPTSAKITNFFLTFQILDCVS